MFVHRVLLALVGAARACRAARFEGCAGEVGVVPGVPGQDASGGFAEVGAVQVRADALRQLGNHFLAQARVGACGA
ncbi:hypothetical protein DC31_00990 [Microbacterium sp. CH12i]|uniref:hypothetical protein n=1 Tax=Microbacterium sp. CH12i TaxID=1479651 RepID=UPI000460D7D3|nr:hypothetical protein [Microbacterium sp. CH12i]KDA07212.1 hypothetical protein DC31_00990 [Microbacterium sp. CH12i]